ncbi:MAG: zinc-binding dehydrogenase [Chloroflexi bacterium]|nr:zinc-binding dehydrogenase [Chloroflexota bacterium]
MKAAVYYETGPPSVFKYEDVADPACPPGGLLIDVEAISIEGGDTLNRGGGEMPNTPHIVGYQCAGTIREVGPEVSERSAGERVVAVMPFGSHAALVAVPENAVWLLPENMDIQQAASIPVPFGTADDCLFEFGKLQAGETVLIQAGAGGVGLAAIQLAKRAGATVLATASSDERLERLKEFGLDHGLNYKTGDFVAEARALTDGRGVDLVVDSVGGKTLQGSLESLRYRGRAISVGQAGRDNTPPDLGMLSAGNRTLTGVFLGAELAIQPDRVRAIVAGHIADVASGALRAVIDRAFPLSDAAEAHAYIESRQAFGRVVLVP